MEKILETVKRQIDTLLEEKNFVIVAIDGKCTSGKTTLAGKLAELYDCNVFHMDDFFLRPEQRTPERFAEVGGNGPLREFCVSDFRQTQECHVIHVHDGGLFPLATALPVG